MTKTKMKLRLITIVSLALMFVLTLSLAIGMLPMARKSASAATYQPSSIFASGTGGTVGSNKPEETEEGATYWMQFTLQDNGSVHYRRDLALKWFEALENAENSDRANPAKTQYFSMQFSFPEVRFETLEITFQSAEENITKAALATNKLFFENTEGKLFVSVRDAYFDEDVDETPAEDKFEIADPTADLTFTFSEEDCSIGEFAVSVQVGKAEPVFVGKFVNIGGYFLEYRSSAATTPQTPMTFTVDLPDATVADEADETKPAATQLILMKSLNGQTFVIGDDGRIEDNAKPVLVLNEAVYSFRLGQRFSLTYEAIDVCDDSVSVSRSYYMLTNYENGDYKIPTNSDYKTLTTSTFFMPTSDDGSEQAYVSIRFKLDDGTHSDYYVYLTWYAANDEVVATLGNPEYEARYVCDVCGKEYTTAEFEALGETCTGKTGTGDDAKDCTGTKEKDIKLIEDNEFDYIVVDLKANGPQYIGIEANADEEENKGSAASEKAIEEYQKAVNDAAEKVSAGDGAYLYLPSLRGLIESSYADYRNLRFSVYYYKPGTTAGGSATSATSLRYNNLRIEVDEVGDYRFRVIAQDAASNAMKYYDEDGELVTLTASNVWDIEGIPEFTFFVDYNGPSIEEAGSQTEGTRDKTYSITKFDIIALDGYETDYTLYYFNTDKLPEGKEAPTYKSLVELVDESKGELEQWILDCLEEISVYNPEVSKDDDEWDRTHNAYAWNPDSSLSFCPQQMGTYFVKVDVTDSYLINTTTSAYQVIFVRNPLDRIPGRTNWLQNNVAAVVLFSISAVLLVAIIVLFVVKPSDQTVEDVDLDSLKGKKKAKK